MLSRFYNSRQYCVVYLWTYIHPEIVHLVWNANYYSHQLWASVAGDHFNFFCKCKWSDYCLIWFRKLYIFSWGKKFALREFWKTVQISIFIFTKADRIWFTPLYIGLNALILLLPSMTWNREVIVLIEYTINDHNGMCETGLGDILNLDWFMYQLINLICIFFKLKAILEEVSGKEVEVYLT